MKFQGVTHGSEAIRRMLPRCSFGFLAIGLLFPGLVHCPSYAADPSVATSPYFKWPRGPSKDASFFPIAVWLQNPNNAQRYRSAGFNTYVGLWRGPTDDQLGALRKAGMHLICEQSDATLQHSDDETIIGWMHGDEPDNAQELPNKSGYGPPITPQKIVESYRRLRSADPSRPIMLNLGQGVAWDQWYGRGSRSNHPEDYPKYIEGCDIVSFDIYPVVHDNPQVVGKLNFVGQGVERLIQWTRGTPKLVWNCIECTHISNPDRKPSSHEVRAEAWMSIIYGSQGLIYFVHQFKPEFREAALLEDGDMLRAVSKLNREITELAPVLNEPALEAGLQLQPPGATVKTLLKRHNGTLYLFVVEIAGGTTAPEFRLTGAGAATRAEVLSESRIISLNSARFKDEFKPWDVHLYRLGHENIQERR